MFFEEIYNNSRIYTGLLRSLWEFEPRGDSYILNSSNTNNSGQFIGGSSYYSNSGSGSFDGSSYASILNYSDLTSKQFTVMMMMERLNSGNCVLLSSYATGLSSSGVTIGITDSNYLYGHLHYSGLDLTYTFKNIPVPKKGVYAFCFNGLSLSINYCDIKSNSLVSESWTPNSNSDSYSNSFFIGGNPDYESNYGFSKFSGALDQFVYLSSVISNDKIVELAGGFKSYNDSVSVSSSILDEYTKVRYDDSLIGNMDQGSLNPIVSLSTSLSNYFVSGVPSGNYQGTLTGSLNGASMDVSGSLYRYINFKQSGTPIYYYDNIPSVTGSGSFTDKFTYIYDNVENVIMTHVVNYTRPEVQVTPFKVYYDVDQRIKSVTTLPSSENIDYTNFNFNGIVLKENYLNPSSIVLKTKNAAPSGINVTPKFNYSQRRFSTVNLESNIELYISGDSQSYTVSNGVLNVGGTRQDKQDEAVYDKSGISSVQLSSGSNVYSLTGDFMPLSSILFTGDKRILLENYLEIDNYSLLWNKIKNTDSGTLNSIFNNYTGSWE